MDFHPIEFFRRQLSGLRKYLLWNSQLADVVQHRGGAQRVQFRLAQPQILPELHRAGPQSPRYVFSQPPSDPDRFDKTGTSNTRVAGPRLRIAIRTPD